MIGQKREMFKIPIIMSLNIGGSIVASFIFDFTKIRKFILFITTPSILVFLSLQLHPLGRSYNERNKIPLELDGVIPKGMKTIFRSKHLFERQKGIWETGSKMRSRNRVSRLVAITISSNTHASTSSRNVAGSFRGRCSSSR